MIQSAPAFTSDNVKALLRDHAAGEDVLDAVLALHETGSAAPATDGFGAADDLSLIFRRAAALERMLATDDGRCIRAAFRRADQMIRAQQAKDGQDYGGKPERRLYQQKEERELAVALSVAKHEAGAAVGRADFTQAMHAIASLRPFVEAFFDKVPLETDVPEQRDNRLRLLNELRAVTRVVADFSKLEE